MHGINNLNILTRLIWEPSANFNSHQYLRLHSYRITTVVYTCTCMPTCTCAIIWHAPHSTDRRALWAADEKRDMGLQLDPTEGPQRVRRRMMRAPTTVHEKHLLPKAAERRRKKKNGMLLMELMIFRSEGESDMSLHCWCYFLCMV